MSENQTYIIPHGEEVGGLINSINFNLSLISNRLDKIEGLRGTPEFYSDINMRSNRIVNLGNSSLTAVWPIGSIFLSVVATNPGTLLGFGTWVAFGAGKTIIGLDPTDTSLDTVKETGGAKTHTLTAAEMPAHTHTQDAHNHGVTDAGHSHYEQSYDTTTGASWGLTIDYSMSGATRVMNIDTQTTTTGITVDAATAVNQTAGSGGAHNNLPPYIVVYMWERTA